MLKQRGWSRFEWLIVVSAIGLVLLIGIARYLDLARESRRVGFELLAHNFTAAIAMTRAQWLVKNSGEKRENVLDLGEKIIYFNAEGWPVAAKQVASSIALEDEKLEDEKLGEKKLENENLVRQCYELWQVMLQNPEPATLEGKSDWGQRRYHIASLGKGVCRYQLVTKKQNSHFFDYFLHNGQVLITVPVQDSVSSL